VLTTVPTIGWLAKDREARWGFSVAKYGAQQSTECSEGGGSWCHGDAGNGTRAGGGWITGNDPHDTSIESDETSAQRWIAHIKSRVGSANEGGVRYYALDNEPGLWHQGHRDVHHGKLGYDELWEKTQRYGKAVKAADPQAKTFGPAEWGWCGYLDAAGSCGQSQDKKNHGD
jgi:hypothetical protein